LPRVARARKIFEVAGNSNKISVFCMGNHEQDAVIRPVKSIGGSLRMAGDKSISHRYAMLAAIAEGETRLTNFSTGADCASTLQCLRQLGCAIQQDTKSNVSIAGTGGRLQAPAAPLDCGNSGSTMRMLAGVLAGQEFECKLTGDASLSRRPMGRI